MHIGCACSRSWCSHGTEKDRRGANMASVCSLHVWSVLLFPQGRWGKKTQYGFYDSVDCTIVKVCLRGAALNDSALARLFTSLHFRTTFNTSLLQIRIQTVYKQLRMLNNCNRKNRFLPTPIWVMFRELTGVTQVLKPETVRSTAQAECWVSSFSNSKVRFTVNPVK